MGSTSKNPLPFSYLMLGWGHNSYGELPEGYAVNPVFF